MKSEGYISVINRSLAAGLFCWALLTGCNQQNHHGFPQKISLEHNTIRSGDDFTVKAGMIKTTNNYVVNHDIYSRDYLFTVFNKKNLEKLDELARVGQGPGEISKSGFFTVDKVDDVLWLYDAGKNQIVKYDLSQKDSIQVPDGKVVVPESIAPVTHFSHMGNQTFVSQNYREFNKYSFVMFDSSGYIRPFGEPYRTEDPIVINDYFQQYSFLSNAHPKNNQFVRAFRHYDIIQIVDESGQIIHKYKGEHFVSLKDTSKPKSFYRNIRITKNYIYAEYVGGPLLNENDNGLNYPQVIRVFDWHLKPLAILKLDISIISFDIDIQNDRFIAFIENEKEPLAYFDFNEDVLAK